MLRVVRTRGPTSLDASLSDEVGPLVRSGLLFFSDDVKVDSTVVLEEIGGDGFEGSVERVGEANPPDFVDRLREENQRFGNHRIPYRLQLDFSETVEKLHDFSAPVVTHGAIFEWSAEYMEECLLRQTLQPHQRRCSRKGRINQHRTAWLYHSLNLCHRLLHHLLVVMQKDRRNQHHIHTRIS